MICFKRFFLKFSYDDNRINVHIIFLLTFNVDMRSYFFTILQVEMKGISGPIEFKEGRRIQFKLDLLKLKQHSLVKVGTILRIIPLKYIIYLKRNCLFPYEYFACQ